jgi:uncharacterized protein YdaU (DUF1376 family)
VPGYALHGRFALDKHDIRVLSQILNSLWSLHEGKWGRRRIIKDFHPMPSRDAGGRSVRGEPDDEPFAER